MKMIIKGKKYDTETALMLVEYSNGYPAKDFNYLIETLYRKRNGEYFLYAEGGANTGCAEINGGGWTSGWKIIPMELENAKKWVEIHFYGDVYEEIFGEVEE